MSEENKAISRRVFEEAWNKGDLAVIDEVTSPDYIDHDSQNPHAGARGPDAVKPTVMMYREAFPDLEFRIEAIYSDGDCVIMRWMATGTHDGELPGMPATGRHVSVSGISIDRIEDGKIVESWTNWDTLGMLQQLGAIPAPEASVSA